MHRLEKLREAAGLVVVTLNEQQSIDFVYGLNNDVVEPRVRSHSFSEQRVSKEFSNVGEDTSSSKESSRSSSLCQDFPERDDSWASLERPSLPRRMKKRSLATVISDKIRSRSKHSSESPRRKDADGDQLDSESKEPSKTTCDSSPARSRAKSEDGIKGKVKEIDIIVKEKSTKKVVVKGKAKEISSKDIVVKHEKITEIAVKEKSDESRCDDVLHEKKKIEEERILKDKALSLCNLSRPLYTLDDEEQDELEKCPWFHNIDTDSATLRLLTLEQEGAFLVRPSSNPARKYPYVLAVYHEGRVVNIPLTNSDEGWTAMGSKKTNKWAFPTVQALIKYCKTNYIGLRPSSGLTGYAILTVTPNKL